MAKDKTKAWYDDIDAATLQRIKTYSAFNDAKSKNLMMQTMYEYREKEIQDFKETNHELAETCIARKKRIAELEEQIEKMKCPQNCKNGSVYNWSDNSICMDCEKVRTLHEDNWQEMCKGCKYWELRR